MPTYRDLSESGTAFGGPGLSSNRTRSVTSTNTIFGQVMGLVALTIGCAALGAYVGRNLQHGLGFGGIIILFACIFGMQWAVARGREQLAIGLLFGLGLVLGISAAPIIHFYAQTQPSALWQAAGSTAIFCGVLGAAGYATRRDLSVYYRFFFFALIALLLFGLVAIFVAIPHANVIYCALGLVVIGGLTVLDFNRLRMTKNAAAAPLIAASIFLDIFNVFLFMLSLFGGGGNRR